MSTGKTKLGMTIQIVKILCSKYWGAQDNTAEQKLLLKIISLIIKSGPLPSVLGRKRRGTDGDGNCYKPGKISISSQ